MISFYHVNLVNQIQTVITAGDENSFFPASNIADDRRTKVYRSNGVSDSIVFDFSSIEGVDSILIVPHIINGFGFSDPVTVEANATDSWGAPAFSTTITSSEIDQSHNIAIKEFTEESYRFWRLTFSSGSYVEVANVFIGKQKLIGTSPANRSISLGWSYQSGDRSTIQENRYGQKFIDEIARQKAFTFQFEILSKDELDDFLEMYDRNGKTIPFYVRIGCDNMINNKNRFSGLVYFEEMPEIINNSFGRYDLQVTLREAM
jgi:hypothetical protein